MVNGAAIAKINFKIVQDIKNELRNQGHFFTGSLEQSFEEKQILTESDVILEAYAYAYLEDLEKGVAADKIPALDTKSEEFINLAKWVKAKGLESAGRTYMSAESIAEAIWRKWQKVGKPLDSSKEFSKSGEILNAIDITFGKYATDYFNMIDEEAVLTIDKQFFK